MIAQQPDVVAAAYYSLTDAARLLQVNRSTIYRWISAGYIKVKYHSRTLRPRVRGADLIKIWQG